MVLLGRIREKNRRDTTDESWPKLGVGFWVVIGATMLVAWWVANLIVNWR